MLKYILHIVMTLCVGAVLYLIARVLPRVDDTETTLHAPAETHWVMHYIERIDEWVLSMIEKLLRRVRVFTMKLDNILSKKLHRFKRETPKDNILGDLPKENGENHNGNGVGKA